MGLVGGDDLEGADRQVLDASGRIIKDNVYGSIEEDAWRRDFTINALYYDIADFSILDYVGGMDDIAARQIRLIGDPETRFREDPVRMVRAVRFAAKLDLDIEAATAAAIPRLAPLIDGVPPARLFDEFLKVFETGHALASFHGLVRHGLFAHLFPATGAWLAADDAEGRRRAFIEQALANTDARVAAGMPVTPMFLFGVFLWGPVTERARELAAGGLAEVPALVQAAAAFRAAPGAARAGHAPAPPVPGCLRPLPAAGRARRGRPRGGPFLDRHPAGPGRGPGRRRRHRHRHRLRSGSGRGRW